MGVLQNTILYVTHLYVIAHYRRHILNFEKGVPPCASGPCPQYSVYVLKLSIYIMWQYAASVDLFFFAFVVSKEQTVPHIGE